MIWETYPEEYRFAEVQAITAAVRAGECAALVGLSGSGKSNLLAYLAHNLVRSEALSFFLVDCNRLSEYSSSALFRLARTALDSRSAPAGDEFTALDQALAAFGHTRKICLLFDRFDALLAADLLENSKKAESFSTLAGNLRALRDAHKYILTFVVATRRPLIDHTELAELFYAHTLWLGPLSQNDALWNVQRYSARLEQNWNETVIEKIIQLSGAYPSFLRSVCEAYAAGCALNLPALAEHPAVLRRLHEFWADHPSEMELALSRLADNPLLASPRLPLSGQAQLTAKEHLLWEYLVAHPHLVCEKDDIIRAVWPEDRIFERGVRDDSLAQLVRRLREKIEPDPSTPRSIHTVPGRGYRFIPDQALKTHEAS